MKTFDKTELVRMGIASVGKPAVLFARGDDSDVLYRAVEAVKENFPAHADDILGAIILEQVVFFDTLEEAHKLYLLFDGDEFYASDIYAELFNERGESCACNT
jgi:hypothetical protein